MPVLGGRVSDAWFGWERNLGGHAPPPLRPQIDLMITFAPPPASGAGAARRVNLLIVVIPAQNAALGRQVGN